ncbi:hypothetical protein Q649_00403 [Bartonella quintana JK 73]|uniref:Uncharacterized protein n=1 Tax=Bartonella quintana JK 73 TaxID=1402976 RepID=W3TZJ2_BARQI|nr:hypothetical protein Q650_00394 [Bartonella quintana JK 73rel]ETS16845.1 hypothetical protein Q649_00403 [Bartonella quintana JK 73]
MCPVVATIFCNVLIPALLIKMIGSDNTNNIVVRVRHVFDMPRRLAAPFCKVMIFSFVRLFLSTPLFIFNARIVTTITVASGTRPVCQHLILKNFFAPRSAPNPASMIT